MRFARRLRLSPHEVVDIAFAVLLTVAGLYSFRSAYGGIEFFVVGCAGVVIATVAVMAGLRTKVPTLVIVAALFALYVVLGGAIALRSQASAGFLPSLDTVTGALTGCVSGWKELLTTVPPVGQVGNLMVLPFFCGAFGAGLSLLAARRLTPIVVAAVPSTAVLALGILCGIDRPVSVLLHGGGFAVLLLIWFALRHRRSRAVIQVAASDRRRRTLGGVGLVAAAAAVGLVLGPNLPLVQANERVILRDTLEPPFDPFDYPSPLAGYRQFVKPLKDVPLFTVEGLPEGVPIRLATMDDFDGVVWRVTGGARAKPGASGYFERVGTNVEPEFAGQRATIRITIDTWTDVWLPTVGEVISLRFEGPRERELNESFRYNRATDTGAMQLRNLRPGDSYVMDVVLPTAGSAVQDGVLLGDRPNASNDLVPDSVTTWASPVVQKVTDTFARVDALRAELSVGYYSDGSESELDSLGGHSSGRLEDFVGGETLVGNAEQYAAAFGLMLRGIGIPSRVVMGFVPNDWVDGPIEVTGFETEAWVEVPVAGVGWVHFDATPDRKRKQPEEAPKPRPLPERNTQVPPPPPVLAEDPRSEPARESAGQQDADKPEAVAGPSGGLPMGLLIAGGIVGFPVMFVSAAACLIVWLKRRRRRSRQREGSGSERASNGFREVLDTARDLGRPVPPNCTRRELAGFVGAQRGAALAQSADSFVFAPEHVQDEALASYWEQVDETVDEMLGQVGRLDRVRARLSLASLRKGDQ